MAQKSKNVQLFALRKSPPETVCLCGSEYRLASVFKHDFFAATCLYEAARPESVEIPRVVIKFGRVQEFWGLPLDWYGRWLCRHEKRIYARLAGLKGVPRWAGCVNESTYAIEYIDAVPLDHLAAAPPGYFDRLLDVFQHIHERGVAYCDANKRSNFLVDAEGNPFVIDYQISACLREEWPWPMRLIPESIVRRAQKSDIYHIYKHKRRLAPGELTPQEEGLSRRRSPMHILHRKITAQWREMRRKFLRHQYQAGRLNSPTADLEEHHQPEKETWRTKD